LCVSWQLTQTAFTGALSLMAGWWWSVVPWDQEEERAGGIRPPPRVKWQVAVHLGLVAETSWQAEQIGTLFP
jgi:hypothetical protein